MRVRFSLWCCDWIFAVLITLQQARFDCGPAAECASAAACLEGMVHRIDAVTAQRHTQFEHPCKLVRCHHERAFLVGAGQGRSRIWPIG
ncbi:hypothetical protein [Xanthomonas arboricola]|uniref:hypothetical protein n=1 Tax=Xanthomonas arboricola TaxID=56448 RepID=UPI001E659073|nr:hypothetical protein [Xanthomonas arboricola]